MSFGRSSHSKVNRLFDTAQPYKPGAPFASGYAVLAELPDMTECDVQYNGAKLPHSIEVKDETEFRRLIEDIGSHPALRGRYSPAALDGYYRHEMMHAGIFGLYEPRQLLFGVSVELISNPTDTSESFVLSAHVRASGMRMPKIAIAAAIAKPLDPSWVDLEHIRQMGYGGVPDVARGVVAYNFARTSSMPQLTAPLSDSTNDSARYYTSGRFELGINRYKDAAN